MRVVCPPRADRLMSRWPLKAGLLARAEPVDTDDEPLGLVGTLVAVISVGRSRRLNAPGEG